MNLSGPIAHRGVRRAAFLLHLAAGLGLGVWLVLVSLSGSLIVFRDEIEDALHRPLTRVPTGNGWTALQPILDRAKAAHPGATFHTVNLPTAPDRSVSFWGHDAAGRSFHAYANPFTGELLGADLAGDNPTEWLYLFHAQLLGQGTGERINGLGAIAWVFLFGSGLILWLPRKGRPWRDGFLVRWQAQARRRLYDLHRAAGFWSALPLLLVVVTGAYFPFKEPFRWLAETVTGTPAAEDAPRPLPRTADQPVVSLDDVIAASATVLPGFAPNWIHLPEDSRDVFTVRKRRPGEWRREGSNHLHVDPLTGDLLRSDLHAERSAAQRVLRAMFPLHVGTFGGWVTQLLWVLLGLVPAVLFVSGVLMWWRRLRPSRNHDFHNPEAQRISHAHRAR
jgi:uncharacterized iron-regulated membrane protein